MIAVSALFALVMTAAFLWLAWITIRRANADVTWLRTQVTYYQRRGDDALDKIATVVTGQPITVSRDAVGPTITAETLEQEVRRMVLGDPEVAHAGQVQ